MRKKWILKHAEQSRFFRYHSMYAKYCRVHLLHNLSCKSYTITYVCFCLKGQSRETGRARARRGRAMHFQISDDGAAPRAAELVPESSISSGFSTEKLNGQFRGWNWMPCMISRTSLHVFSSQTKVLMSTACHRKP